MSDVHEYRGGSRIGDKSSKTIDLYTLLYLPYIEKKNVENTSH